MSRTVDRAGHAEKSVRKDEKTLFWQTFNYRSFGYQTKGKQNSTEITNN